MLNQIRDIYFIQSEFSEHLLDAAWKNLPNTSEIKAKYGAAKRNAKSYDVTFMMCLQKVSLDRMKKCS